ncbi:MFS general substrate transporter [Delitschia confertaspora ATCC 74209]|uniref:MFS general substrate transporter n=1 Tax=Delitschia confertaspora ATCC 74209 TaxID=1513339 RepID=A0A9P4MRS9_9PLEO|nr:MFS general substrate transporter [Delitschia confertaspora ATCC 74209]
MEPESKAHKWQSYSAQALILFNVWGIPLSFGSYIEFYWNNHLYDEGLFAIISIFAMQLFGILSFSLITGSLLESSRYTEKPILWTAASGVIACQFLLSICTKWHQIFIVQGVVLGICLGMLLVTSTMALATHFDNYISVASTISSSIGPIGAIVFTITTHFLFQHDDSGFKPSCYANGTLSFVTLGIACMLQRPAYSGPQIIRPMLRESLDAMMKEKGMMAFTLGYMCIWSVLLVWPTYIVLYIAQITWPHTGSTVLLTSLVCTYLAHFFASKRRILYCWGAVNMVIASSLLCAISYFAFAFNPSLIVYWVFSPIYFFAMGVVTCLYVRLPPIFTWMGGEMKDDPICMAVILTLAGISAVVGQVIVALVILNTVEGAKMGMVVSGSVMLLGSVSLGVARGMRNGWGAFYVI